MWPQTAGKGFSFFDKLERVHVAAFGNHADIALDGNMRRAVALAGGGAGVIAVGGRIVVSVIFVPHFRAPFGLIRQHLLRIDDRPLLRTQLLPELGGTRRAHLGALTAGNALFRIDMRAVSGCGHIRCVEQLAGAQRVAGADAAVADAEDLVLAVNIRDLVHKAVFLGALQDLHDLFARCRARFIGLDGVGRHVTDGNAHVLFQMAAALIAHSAGPAAGAGADRILAVVLIQPVRQMLQIDRLLLRRDRLFERDGTLAELTFHTDWMRYDCYVDLSGAVLGAFRENWLPFLGGLVLVVGLSALRLSALVNDLGFGIGTALYAFAAGALAISAMVLPGISGSSLLMSCGLCLPVIAAMKDLLQFQFGQFRLLAAVGLGLLAGFAIAPHCIRGWMRKAPGAVTYAVLGMMLGSLYAIIVGPTTLKVPQHAMTISDFHLIFTSSGSRSALP